MLTPEERSYIWHDLYSRVHDLFIDVEDVLDSKFAPYKYENGELVQPDKDTPKVKELFDMVADLDGFLKVQDRTANREYSDWLDVEANKNKAFEAWSLGLCPQEMLAAPKHMDFACEAWPEIAKLKQERGISREDTAQALALWEARKTVERIAS